jgi:hypothetical protein
MCALPAPKSSPLAKDLMRIKNLVDSLISKMQRDHHFMPTRNQLEEPAEKLISYINNNHSQVVRYESHLKAAIIDLTEVPVMAPQMQRISFLTALKDASHEMNLFLSCL